MIIIGVLSWISGLIILNIVYQGIYDWFIPGIILLGFGIHTVIDKMANLIENRNIEYHSLPLENCQHLFTLTTEDNDQLILSSTMPKLIYFCLFFLGVLPLFIISGCFFYNYLKMTQHVWLLTSLTALIIGSYFLVMGFKHIKSKEEKICVDKKKQRIIVNSLIYQDKQIIPFKHIKRIIIKSYDEPGSGISEFLNTIYQVTLETHNGRRKLLEKGYDQYYIKKTVKKIADILQVKVLDLTDLGLSMNCSNSIPFPSNQDEQALSNINYNVKEKIFQWKNKDSYSIFIIESFFLLMSLASMVYSVAMTSMPFEMGLIFLGISLILAIVIIRDNFGMEQVTFTKDSVEYQYQLFYWIIKEKKMAANEVRSIVFSYDDAIIEGENDYIIGNISKLTHNEKKWLEKQFNNLLNFSSLEKREAGVAQFG